MFQISMKAQHLHTVASFRLCQVNCKYTLWDNCTDFPPVQASGYGSGDDTYEDMEGRDEVKKVVEEREYTEVCTVQTLTHTPTEQAAC